MKQKSDSIQALRALACLCIFFYHCYSKTQVAWGVSSFFYVSGFLLVYRHCDDDPNAPGSGLRFALGKMKKLYPLYILSMLPLLALEVYSALNGLSEDTLWEIGKRFAAVLLMIQSWIPNNHYVFAFNGVGWFVSASFFTYLIFPAVLRRIRGYRRIRSAYISAAGTLALMFALGFAAPVIGRLESRLHIPSDDSFEMWFTYNFPPFRALEFIIGCNLGYIFLRRKKEYSKKELIAADCLMPLLFFPAVLICRKGTSLLASDAFRYAQLFAPFCIVFVYSFAVGKCWSAKLLTNRFTVYLGNISSHFFLIHMVIMKFYFIFMERTGVSGELIQLLLVPVAGGLSVLCSLVYDRCMRRLSAKSYHSQSN